ncbi:DUF4433 domain-containing protein [bacterium M00.F.Ca.ET.228.01.1.1]|uniref:DUF4433 domain-containing protein n=1 Tax=Paraburkholderia phenoliruptrix TaxID=252970 RepID=UPI0010921BAE|nr:DUF4433 domain-containing protein [Paraburkholderia phenoliruptrix]TGP44777.1 DUF4433 domain-containing protein [bacterium M00.F.Ca.ET.228.01.1.1]TGS02660.1 DUF4433 domain-containing protein [bacterium M00.F.Ca.ET.191.01.1.1]TGU06042.1 DUF4433 domain-containing protein [bacterium M00.F.Ca.ET.155.01.1.1]
MNAALVPPQPKIYHIAHVDRLPSIVADGFFRCDAEVVQRAPAGTTIGMSSIKQRRLNELRLSSYPELHVGDCVPFYFCPRSVMLYLIYQGNHQELAYRGGQGPILHFEADLHAAVAWAHAQPARWAFTNSNAGSRYFEDYNVPGAVEEAKDYLAQHEISRTRFERVTRLVEGFESPYGLELLATVHWVMSREGATQHDSVARHVYDWNARKQQFTPRQLAIAEERLKSQGWLPPEPVAIH